MNGGQDGAYTCSGAQGSFGKGGAQDSGDDSGGGGGGWYGGCSWGDSDAGGGSGYTFTSSSDKTGYSGNVPSSSYYLSSTSTVSGNVTNGMPDPTSSTGATMTGRAGDGYARISYEDPNASPFLPLPSGTLIFNGVCVSSGTADGNRDNNCDDTTTTIGTSPNVYTKNTGPSAANINKEFKYVIEVGNNGNASAANWQMLDNLPSQVAFVSYSISSQTNLSGNITCAITGTAYSNQVLTCTHPSGNLPADSKATIEVTVRVANNQSLVDNNTIIRNTACSTTSDTQTTISDDCSEYPITIIQGNAGAIIGRVFVDRNRDVQFAINEDRAVPDVTITLTGTDTKGNSVTRPTTTDASGFYFFFDVYPGTYTTTMTRPSGYFSTGSTGGYLTVDTNGNFEHSPKDGQGSVQTMNPADDLIVRNIIIEEGDYSQGNNFGLLSGGIGDLVWLDLNNNSYVDPNEPGIGGVLVCLHNDINNNGVYDEGIDTQVACTRTNPIGLYFFDDLPVGNYIVLLPEEPNQLVLADLSNSAPKAGHETEDNWSKLASGYAVALTTTNPTNLTADFGFHEGIDPLIKVFKTDNRDSVSVGETITYVITITNTPRVLLRSDTLTVVDTLPAELDYISSSNLGLYNSTDRTVTWTIFNLEFGTITLTVTAKVNQQATDAADITNLVNIYHKDCDNVGSICDNTDTNIRVNVPGTGFFTKSDSPTDARRNLLFSAMIIVSLCTVGFIFWYKKKSREEK
jgi:uncharacterized repeat protein (TIGR01451 family)